MVSRSTGAAQTPVIDVCRLLDIDVSVNTSQPSGAEALSLVGDSVSYLFSIFGLAAAP